MLPIKLMDINIVNVDKDEHYTTSHKDKIDHALQIVDRLLAIPDDTKRRSEYYKEFKKVDPEIAKLQIQDSDLQFISDNFTETEDYVPPVPKIDSELAFINEYNR
jgi:hypothetical protein